MLFVFACCSVPQLLLFCLLSALCYCLLRCLLCNHRHHIAKSAEPPSPTCLPRSVPRPADSHSGGQFCLFFLFLFRLLFVVCCCHFPFPVSRPPACEEEILVQRACVCVEWKGKGHKQAATSAAASDSCNKHHNRHAAKGFSATSERS